MSGREKPQAPPSTDARRRKVACGPPWFQSVSDSGYAKAEQNFVAAQIIERSLRPSRWRAAPAGPLAGEEARQRRALARVVELCTDVDSGSFPAVLKAIDWLRGDLNDPLHPPLPVESLPAGLTRDLAEQEAVLRARVRAVKAEVSRASKQADTPRERSWIAPILRALVEGRRPGRPRDRPHVAIVADYWRMVFRWGQAQAAYQRERLGPVTPASARQRVWDAFGLEAFVTPASHRLHPEKAARAHLIRALETPDAPEPIARFLCACIEKRTEARLRNILSTYRLS